MAGAPGTTNRRSLRNMKQSMYEQSVAVIVAAGGNYTVIRLLFSVLCYG